MKKTYASRHQYRKVETMLAKRDGKMKNVGKDKRLHYHGSTAPAYRQPRLLLLMNILSSGKPKSRFYSSQLFTMLAWTKSWEIKLYANVVKPTASYNVASVCNYINVYVRHKKTKKKIVYVNATCVALENCQEIKNGRWYSDNELYKISRSIDCHNIRTKKGNSRYTVHFLILNLRQNVMSCYKRLWD